MADPGRDAFTGVTSSDGSTGEVVLYSAPDGTVTIDVRLERENIWLSLNQMAALFERDKSVISRHLRNVFATKELEREATVAFFATVQDEGGRRVERQIEYFDLDAIISVGYRVNSKRGTQFRIWATRVLRDHLVQGYTVNQNRLRDLNQAVRLIAETANRKDLSGDEAQALLAIVGEYNRALDLLDDYDHQRVAKPESSREVRYVLDHSQALQIVGRLRERFRGSGLFGVERDETLRGALNAVLQTFGGVDLYLGLEEKAANLLYFLVKDHPFVDGNKRIAASLFLWFLERNGALFKPDGSPRISNNSLVALTLMMAESRPEEKDILVRIAMHLLVSEDPGEEQR
ncbi:MAG TPA: RhuM family protein [Thermoleophilia bacterium]|nr:RhuM family protein [Thermoleophilia bacterium]